MTGREIVSFFAAYGYVSLYLLPILFLLFFFFFRKIIRSGDVIEEKMKNKVVTVLIFLLNMTLACSMFSALRELFFSFLPHITALCAFLLLIASSVFVCFGGVKKLVKVNILLFPFMFVCILAMLAFGLFMHSENGFFFNLNIYNLPIFSALYAAFNLALGSVVVSQAGDGLSAKKATVLAGVSSAILCSVIAVGIVVICNNASEILLADMPFFLLAGKIGTGMQVLIFLSIVFAGGTSLFASLVTLKTTVDSVLENREKRIENRGGLKENQSKSPRFWRVDAVSSLFVCLVTLAFSFIGFGKIIDLLYPVAGVIAIYLILSLFFENKDKNYKFLQKT